MSARTPQGPRAGRGDIVVCVDASSRAGLAGETLRAVLASVAEDTPVLVFGQAGPADERVVAVPGGLDAAIAAAAPADVVLVRAGCVPAGDWLARLTDVARGDAGVATVSAAPPDERPVMAATSAARLDAPSGPCVLIRRAAIDLAGPPDADLTGFAARCTALGLAHLAAPRQGGPRPRGPLTVTIDARILGVRRDGTRTHILELAAALARTGRVRVTAAVAPHLDAETRALLQQHGVALATGRGTPADIVHRPHQVSTPADLAALAALGQRLVVTHQDLIAFHNPAYFASARAWDGYRTLTRRALAAAAAVVFPSAHVRGEALSAELVEPGRAEAIPLGVDHVVVREAPATPPQAAASLTADTILCLGTDLRHKNRPFALRVAAELQARHGWAGRLVLAGPRVPRGSSRPDEQALLAADPRLAGAVLDLGEVADGERRWLLEHARLAIYPTIQEGFGLIPFEAAEHGVPCLWAPTSSLADLLPPAAAGIVAWDPVATAQSAHALLTDEGRRADQLHAVTDAAAQLRWDAAAHRLVDVYEAVCERPPPPGAAIERGGGAMQGGVSEDGMRLVGPGGVLPRELERPLLALATHPRLGWPVLGGIRAGYALAHRARGRRRRQ